MLGIAVAMVIAMAALLLRDSPSSSFSVTPASQKPAAPDLLKKVIQKINLSDAFR